MGNNKERLVIIDSNALVHRAFHALPPLTTPNGEIVNAVYGFLLVFLKAIKDLEPTHIVATFDLAGPTFRNVLYKEYKANRVKAPDELYQQIPLIKKVLTVFKVPIFEKQGFEADDLIGTIAKKVEQSQGSPKIETIIITGDLDALRLVDEQTKVFTLKKGLKDTIIYNRELVRARYDGLEPEQLTDFRALRGDQSDNIPGVLGIGEKTAISLLKEFGSLENLYKKVESEEKLNIKDKLRDKLKQAKEQAFFSQKLAEIDTNVPINFDLESCRFFKIDREKVVKMFQEFGFYSLIKRLPEAKQIKLGNF